MITGDCEICKAPLTRPRCGAARRFCSKKCANARYNALSRVNRPLELVCACGERYPVPPKGPPPPACMACKRLREVKRRRDQRAAVRTARREEEAEPAMPPPRHAIACESCVYGEANKAAELGWLCAIWAAARCQPLGAAVMWRQEELG